MNLKITGEADLSLEVVILLIFGVFMLIFGVLLFSIHTGTLPYTPDSMYGLFLVLISFQIITMGKTPFGDLRRSLMVIILGICMAVIGMLACFIPGYFTDLVRILVGVILLAGGIALLFQLFISEGKAKSWIKSPGILRKLITACGLVYLLSVISGLVTLLPGLITNPQIASLLILFGMSFLYLAWCIQMVAREYPKIAAESPPKDNMNSSPSHIIGKSGLFSDSALPLSYAILILVGVLLTLLGVLLFPVMLGIIPFSPDGQLGLLLVITSIQIMALGETPVGQYTRSWLLIIIGTVFASLGVVSCIVPGILARMIILLLGTLNVAGGIILLVQRYLPLLVTIRDHPSDMADIPPVFRKLQITQTTLNIVSIAFGLSMLIPGLIPGMVVAGILIINGLLLFKLVSILQGLP